jgi:hypothetical protein
VRAFVRPRDPVENWESERVLDAVFFDVIAFGLAELRVGQRLDRDSVLRARGELIRPLGAR